MALITRLFPAPENKTQIDEFRSLAGSAERNNPGILAEMKADQLSILNRIGIAAFKLPSWNFLSLGGPIVTPAIDAFSRKMAMALHFELTKNFVPEGALLFVQQYTNFDVIVDGFPGDMMDFLGPGRSLQMGQKHVFEQFAYRSAEVEESSITIHMVFYRQALATLLIVYPDPKDLTDEDIEHTVPFFPTTNAGSS